MAIVVDVLRGSRAAKILQYKFDRLPTHGTSPSAHDTTNATTRHDTTRP
jgi:hypothetical protein